MLYYSTAERGARSPRRTCLAFTTLIFLQDMRSLPVLASIALLFALSLACFGQAGKAELFGTIQDPSGLGVPLVKVTGEYQATGARFEVSTLTPRHGVPMLEMLGQSALSRRRSSSCPIHRKT